MFMDLASPTPQDDSRSKAEDAGSDKEGETTGGGGYGYIPLADMEAEDIDPGAAYEAAVWANVAITDLATRKIAQQQQKKKRNSDQVTGGNADGGTGETSPSSPSRTQKASKTTRKRLGENDARSGGEDAQTKVHTRFKVSHILVQAITGIDNI